MMSPLLIFPKYTRYFQCWQAKNCSVSEFRPWPVKRYAAIDINMFTLIPICMQKEKGSANEDFISIILAHTQMDALLCISACEFKSHLKTQLYLSIACLGLCLAVKQNFSLFPRAEN